MRATTEITLNTRIHVPSPFYNRGGNDGGTYHNYGRLEADCLHHVSSAVYAMAEAENNKVVALGHIRTARKLLDRLEEMAQRFPDAE